MSSFEHDIRQPLAPQLTTLAGTNKLIDLGAVAQPNLQTTDHTSIDTNNLEGCLAKFRARLKATKASRFSAVLEKAFIEHMPHASLIWQYYAAVLQHLHQLRSDAEPVLLSLLQGRGRLLRITNPVQAIDDCTKFMDQLDLISKTPGVRRIFATMAQSATQAKRSATESHDLMLLRLIQCIECKQSEARSIWLRSHNQLSHDLALKLRSSAENDLLLLLVGSASRFKSAMNDTIQKVAQTPSNLASAERALYYMPRQQLMTLTPDVTTNFAQLDKGAYSTAKVQRLDIWLRMLQQVDVMANNDKALLKAAMVSLAKCVRIPNAIASEAFVRALLLHQDCDIQVLTTSMGPHSHRFHDLFADALRQLQTQTRSYTAVLDQALPLIAKHAGLGVLVRCVRTLEEQQLPLSTHVDFDSILANELAALPSLTADLSESQKEARASVLQRCERLARALSRLGHALPAKTTEIAILSGSRQWHNILANARFNNALPIAYRDVPTDLSSTERIAMAHQLAYHYSRETTRTHREVWRSIYYLYKYLTSNSLPIGPLFTKAVVHSAITRPLSENRFVSARRLIWVCHLVAKVEGDEVAGRVENRFYTWRGDLIGRAKRIFVGVGGSKQSKAHVATLKRLGLL